MSTPEASKIFEYRFSIRHANVYIVTAYGRPAAAFLTDDAAQEYVDQLQTTYPDASVDGDIEITTLEIG